ncbi:MAG: hypothetical protein ABI612_13080 [Betaproteobacteria bacterium]
MPTILNFGSVAWLAWHLALVPGYAQAWSFAHFASLYAIGGLTIVLSGMAIFFMLASDQVLAGDAGQRRRWLIVALINTSVPSVGILTLLFLRWFW